MRRTAGWHSAQALYSNRTARTLHNYLPSRRRSSRLNQELIIVALVVVFVLCSIGLIICWSFVFPDAAESSSRKAQNLVARIVFGSSSSHDYSAQPVWVRGVIPSNPDTWIWLGGMAYLDEARVDCDATPNHAQCNCSANWLQQPPHFCMTGNLEHATSKMEAQLANPDYAQFLSFMCPGHREKGLFPPAGSDPAVCPRSIFGTYNGHDYGWRHGNKRFPQKDVLKQVFLNAIGEGPDSPRRRRGRGIEWKYTLNQETKHEIDVILLDTRYYRDPLPCYTRKAFCEEIADTSNPLKDWCLDFLRTCCVKDEQRLEGWKPENSDFCEILGYDQSEWLESILMKSKAPLKLLVSSSVVITTGYQDTSNPCAGDDWECYKPAQMNLLKQIGKSSGCVVILTGGLEYSDIRVLKPGLQSRYGEISLSYPLYQLMSSGLTTGTGKNFTCDEEHKDPWGVRDHPECDFVRGPSFGMIEVQDGILKLQIRDGMTGEVKLESKLALASCYESYKAT